MIKNIDSLSNQLQNMSIGEECCTGKDLSNENEFLKKSEKEIKELFSNVICGVSCGKRVMAISMEFESRMTSDNTRKMPEIIEENFAKLKILCEIGWCWSYTIDKRVERKYLFELSWFNISPNRRIYEKK